MRSPPQTKTRAIGWTAHDANRSPTGVVTPPRRTNLRPGHAGRPTRRLCAFGGQRGRPRRPDLPARPRGERKDERTSLPTG